jgi:hypothetical protein
VPLQNRGLERLRDVLDEARSFLSLPRPEPPPDRYMRQQPAPTGSPESARRQFAMSQPISGTIAEGAAAKAKAKGGNGGNGSSSTEAASAKTLWQHAEKLQPKAPWRAIVREFGINEAVAQDAHRTRKLPPGITGDAVSRFLELPAS